MGLFSSVIDQRSIPRSPAQWEQQGARLAHDLRSETDWALVGTIDALVRAIEQMNEVQKEFSDAAAVLLAGLRAKGARLEDVPDAVLEEITENERSQLAFAVRHVHRGLGMVREHLDVLTEEARARGVDIARRLV